MTIRDAIANESRRLRGASDTPFLDALLLLCHITEYPKERILASYGETISPATEERFRTAVDTRLNGTPIAYIIGRREFYGLEFRVDNRVLVPRPESELLVELVVERYTNAGSVSILDVGTGSGCIAISIQHELPDAIVVATDFSPDAVDVCRENSLRLLGREIDVTKSALLDSVDSTFDCIVSNLPYLTTSEWRSAYGNRWAEPKNALDGGRDGLRVIENLIEQSVDSLEHGGYFLLEASPDQMDRIKKKLVHAGFKDITLYRDLAGRERVVGGSYGTFHATVRNQTR